MKIFLFFLFFSSVAFADIPPNGCIFGGGKTVCLDLATKQTVIVNADGTFKILKDGCIIGTSGSNAGKVLCADGSTDGVSGTDPTIAVAKNGSTSSSTSGFDTVVKSITAEIDTVASIGTLINDKVKYLSDFSAAFFPRVISDTVSAVLVDFWDFFLTKLKTVVDGLYTFIKIPDALSAISSLSGGFGYFLELIGFNLFLEVTITAYLVRFGIRRLPIVG